MSSLPCSKYTAQTGSVRVQSLYPWFQGSTKSGFSPTPCPCTAILVNEIAVFYQPWPSGNKGLKGFKQLLLKSSPHHIKTNKQTKPDRTNSILGEMWDLLGLPTGTSATKPEVLIKDTCVATVGTAGW